MKLLSFDDDNPASENKRFGSVSIEIYADDNLLYKHDKNDRIDLSDSQFNFLLKHLSIGDSCHFVAPSERIANIFKPLKLQETNAKEVSVYIKLRGTYESTLDREMIEHSILNSYLKNSKAKAKRDVYLEVVKLGKGKEIEVGDEITIAYKGFFINGLEFDNISGKTAFTFTYGSQGQVIRGLEIAINAMREGQKSKIIIPSQLAFGEVGSTTLIVPPYTTVIYDLEVVKVN